MKRDTRILILEDSVRDVELVERELRRAAIPFLVRKVDTEEDFINGLDEIDPDLIISDYQLPSFDGMRALKIVRARSSLLPFILVTGHIGEERATEALKAGATDFILKNSLERLAPCVQRALREAEERAARQRMDERFALFVEATPNALVLADADGVIEMVNGRTERMFGFSRDRLLGRQIELLFPERFRAAQPGPPLSVFARQSPDSLETPRDLFGLMSDGGEFPVEIELSPIETGENPAILYFIFDVGALRQTEQELDWRRREVELFKADAGNFAQTISDTLKASLPGIDELSRRIRADIDAAASPGLAQNVDLLQSQVKQLGILLDGLLKYSRVGHAQSPIEDVDIPLLVRDLTANLAPRPGFLVSCMGQMEPIRTHREPIRVVLSNLVANGMTHHDREEGRITISMHRTERGVEFRVSDDGPGISPLLQDKIFVIFQPQAIRDDLEASGIGLAIVKRQVEGHGGRIKVESAPPMRGSTFVFTWMETP